MAWELTQEVFDHAPEDLTTGELAVLLAVAEWARRDQRVTEQLAREVGRRARLKPGALRWAFAKLASRGLELRVPWSTDKNGQPVYAVPGRTLKLRLPAFPAPPGCRCQTCSRTQPIGNEEAGAPDDVGDTPGGVNVLTPPLPQGVNVSTPSAPEGVNTLTPDAREGSTYRREGVNTLTQGVNVLTPSPFPSSVTTTAVRGSTPEGGTRLPPSGRGEDASTKDDPRAMVAEIVTGRADSMTKGLARAVGGMLADGVAPDDIRLGLRRWNADGYVASALPTFVSKATADRRRLGYPDRMEDLTHEHCAEALGTESLPSPPREIEDGDPVLRREWLTKAYAEWLQERRVRAWPQIQRRVQRAMSTS